MSQRMPSSRRKTAVLKNHDYFDSSEDEEDGEEEYHNIKGKVSSVWCDRGVQVVVGWGREVRLIKGKVSSVSCVRGVRVVVGWGREVNSAEANE